LFRQALDGKHCDVIRRPLGILKAHFAHEEGTPGYRKSGPVAVAKFEYGEAEDLREVRVLRKRQASDVVDQLLARIGA
jgi:hypothetical protein